MTGKRSETEERMPWDLARFRNWVACGKVILLVRKSLAEALSEVGLDLPQYDVLSAVYRFPGITQTELASKLLVGRSNLSMLLPELEKRRWIKREHDEGDRRVRRLQLTASGRKMAAAGLALQVQLTDHLSQALTDDECDAVGDMMRRVGVFLEQHPFEPD